MKEKFPSLLTLDEVAKIFKVSDSTVRRWTREGRINSFKLRLNNQHRFAKEDVFNLLIEDAFDAINLK